MRDNDYQATIFAGTVAGLQSAIDYINAGTLGGEIRIGPGTILLTSAITLCSDLKISGCGMGVTILKHSGTTLHTLLSGTSIGQITLRDFTLDGDMVGVTSSNADRWAREEAVDLSSVTDLVMENVELTQHEGQAIYGTTCSRVRIEGCWIHDTDNWGSIFKASDDISYIDNHLENTYTHGLYVDSQTVSAGASRIKFIGNTVINCQHDTAHAASGVGISVQKASGTSGVYDVVCIGNTCRGNGSMGFSMTPGSRTSGYAGKMTIIGNHSEGHTAQSGIGYEIIGSHVTMSGNTAKNNKYHCTAQDSKGLAITGNKTVSAIGSTQVHYIVTPATVADHVEDYLLSDNVVEGGTGFQIDSTATTTPHTNVTVKGNQFLYCDFAVLMQANTLNLLVDGNMVDANHASVGTGRGIQVYGDKITVSNNMVWAKTAAGDAITVSSGQTTDQLVLLGNHIFSGRYGLGFYGTVTALLVNGNMISGAGTANTTGKNVVTNWRDGGNNSWNFVTAAPTTEYWHVGTRVYDTAIAAGGNVGWVCTTAGTPGTWTQFGFVGTSASGVYTPTRSAEANLDSNVTMTEAQYIRSGNTVTVSGRFTADPTLTATTTSFEITLPVASNIGAAEDVAGVAFCGNIVSQGAEVIGVVANDTAKIQWKAADVTSQTWSYIFTYQVEGGA